jgi:hypothetical protein
VSASNTIHVGGALLFAALNDACERGSTLLWTDIDGQGMALLDGHFDLDNVAALFIERIKATQNDQSDAL